MLTSAYRAMTFQGLRDCRAALFRVPLVDPVQYNTALMELECRGQGYEPGGLALSGHVVSVGDDGVVSVGWDDAVWLNATLAADSLMIYRPDGLAVYVRNFPLTLRATNGPVVVPLSGDLIRWTHLNAVPSPTG